ncbi:MAG TPA: nucleotidyltransferase family protein [Thermoleophilia bacterium]|nr:nucleotidyltransferase family protein [Thermoleophilia bacterium]
MTTLELIRARRDEILRIAAKHGVSTIRVFGSVARGEAGPESDVDFLVEAGPTTTPWFPAGLIVDLEDLLGRRVEVITDRALNPDLRDHVIDEALPV